MTLQKNVKSHVFLDFEKNVKDVFSNYATGGAYSAPPDLLAAFKGLAYF